MKRGGKFEALTVAIIVAVVLAPMVFTMAEGETPSVIINEIAWAGSSIASNDEWIELKNASEADVDLAEWQISIDNPGTDYTITIPPGDFSVLKPNEFFVIAKFGTNSDKSALNIIVDIGLDFFGFGITNTGFVITLKNKGGEVIDEAWNGSAPTIGYRRSGTGSASIERRTPITDGRLPASWQEAVASVNFDNLGTGVINYGTPKANNSILVEPPTVESISPNTAETGKTLQIENVVGTNFSTDSPPTVQLKLSGKTITAENIHIASSTLIDGGQFSLSSAETGKWDLVITNPNGMTATLPQSVDVTEPPPQYDLTTTVRLNEVYPQPNTTSNDEFIELYNSGDKTVNLSGWILDDIRNGGSSPFVFGAQNILPKSYLVVYKTETKLTLNDSGDDVYLIQPNGFELDHTSYTSAPRGQTWARFDDGWKWTSSPTPNGKNVLSAPPSKDTNSTPIDEPDDILSFQKDDILITELLPNPKEGEEFVELYNNSAKPIEIKNWTLQDKSKHKYKIANFAINIQTTSGLTVQPQQYVVITKTMSGIALNNTGGETVTLFDPNGNVIATVSYPDKAPVGAVYAWDGKTWIWSRYPTPGQVNILGLDEADEPPPNVDIVLPSSLPVTGESSRRWMGILIISIALGAIVIWRKLRHPSLKLRDGL